MLDFIKFSINDGKITTSVWDHSDLIYNSEHQFLNRTTGELKTQFVKTYKNLIFKKYGDVLEVTGSLHKLYNDGKHNANDFSVQNCIKTINNLCTLFGMPPEACNISGLEFGVNFVPPCNVSDVLRWLRFHRKNLFGKYPELKECYFAGSPYFGVKVYNKTLNYPAYAAPNLMRFEGKTRQSKYLSQKNINTLSDLLKAASYKTLAAHLLLEWNNVLIFDKRTKKAVKYCNTDFWLELQNSTNPNAFLNARKKYYKILGKKGLQNLIYIGIREKIDLLFK